MARLWTCLLCHEPCGDTPIAVARHMFNRHSIMRGELETTQQSDMQFTRYVALGKWERITTFDLIGYGDVLQLVETGEL